MFEALKVINLKILAVSLPLVGLSVPTLNSKEVVARVDRKDDVNVLWDKVRSQSLDLESKVEVSDVLRTLLSELNIPVSSQVLVYSKTSLQIDGISPQTPRSIFFNENNYVGWVQGGDIEVIAIDPELGPQYYLIEVSNWKRRRKNQFPDLWRSYDCQSCHLDAGSAIQVLSVNTDSKGHTTRNDFNLLTTYRSPIEERWGGWYVTGGVAQVKHLGNWQSIYSIQGKKLPFSKPVDPNELSENQLSQFFDVSKYLVSSSDVLALMVLEHQSVMHNTICGSGLAMRRVLERAEGKTQSPNVARAAKLHAKKIVEALLQEGDASFDGEVRPGSKAFMENFLSSALKDEKGRSLRDFALQGRLFKYRCSYMIYSRSFQMLPEELKFEIYRRLHDVLVKENNQEFDHLDDEEKKSIAEILQSTLPELKVAWYGLTDS